MTMIPPEILQALVGARKAAYAPYSNFQVGAVALSTDGRAFPGCNVETAHYKSTCAEASAISAMVGAGQREIDIIYVLGPDNQPCPPCGDCRQRIREFAGRDTRVILVDHNGEQIESFGIADLLPHAFGPDNPSSADNHR